MTISPVTAALWTVPALLLFACGGGGGGTGNDEPVCGDNVCSVGDCCQDCGCNMGSACMPNGVCQSVGTTSLTFNLTDECASVSDNIQVRFFDNNDRAVWPAVGQVYLLPPAGQPTTFPLACTLGATVCYGANDVAAGLTWGAGIDGTSACPDCCSTCNGLQTSTIGLVCY